MGQNQSSTAASVALDLPNTMLTCNGWSIEDLLGVIERLNKMCYDLVPNGDPYIHFQLSSKAVDRAYVLEEKFLWRYCARIVASQLAPDGQRVSPVLRQYTMSEVEALLRFIDRHLPPSLPETPQRVPSTTAMDDDLCIICAEREPETVLPCFHAFCDKCIKQWSGLNSTCPMCRSSIGDDSDNFEDVKMPTREDFNEFLTNYIFKRK